MIGGLFSLVNVLERLPEATQLWAMIQRANAGDVQAQEYLKQRGWKDALDVLRPGSADIADRCIEHVQQAKTNIVRTINGDVIDAEWREVFPWEPFKNRLLKQPNSAQIVIGPTGSGKTTFAKKMAWALAEALGYKVEVCSMYGEDKPDFATSISTDTLIARMKQLKAYLKSLDEDEDGLEPKVPNEPVSLPAPNKIILIDEASMTMSSNYADPARRASLQALWQTRHLRWHVIYIAQMLSQLPEALLGQSIIWAKEPAGREMLTDRDNPIVRDVWEQAAERFRHIRQSEYYVEPYAHPKAWVFCDAQSLNGQQGYIGMMPWSPVAEGA